MTKKLHAACAGGVLLVAVTATAQTAPATPGEAALLRRIEAQDAAIVAQDAAIVAQDATIKALTQRLDDVSKVLATRVSAVETATTGGRVVMTAPGPRLESTGSDFSLAFVGSVQPEVAFYHQSGIGAGGPALNNGTSFRRAHFGVQGSAFGDFSYQLIFDGAATGGFTSGVRDAVVSYSGWRPLTLTIGNQKPQTGLESSFSDRSNALTFMEPGLTAVLATVNGTRAIGARLSTGGAHYSASLGVFGDDINNAGIAFPLAEGWGVHGRLTLAPVATPTRLIHLGLSGYRRDPGTGRASTPLTDPVTSQLRFRAQPEVVVDATRLVDTGLLTKVEHYSYLGGEAAAVFGPFSVQGELARSWLNQSGSLVDLQFNSATALASVFLTGESRVYDPRTGVFTRMKPRHAFDKSGGWGAWEIAGRWSRLDLDSHVGELATGGVRGGVLTDTTLGVNWYLNAYLRVMANYIHADANKVSASNVDQGTRADIVAIRLQQEW